jgi:chromate transport protein ChrA
VSGRPTLAALGWRIAADVNRTVGGGLASIELMRQSFARTGWLRDADHALLVAVSRFTPGTNVLAYSAGLGWMAHRAAGVSVALIASSLPSAVLITVASAIVARLVSHPVVRLALAAATLLAAGLILSSAWALLRPHVTGSRRLWAAAVVLGALGLSLGLGLTPVRVLLMAAVWGALLPPREGQR